MAYAASIRMTQRDLLRRRKEIYRELGLSVEAFDAKCRSADPLTDREFSAKEELEEIRFLLGDD